MKIVTRDVYLTEFAGMSYLERFMFVWLNNMNLGVRYSGILEINLRDVCTVILYTIVFPVLLCVTFYEAHSLKTRYVGKPDQGWHKAKSKVLSRRAYEHKNTIN